MEDVFWTGSLADNLDSDTVYLTGFGPKAMALQIIVSSQADVTAAVFASGSAINATTNVFTKTAHGFSNGMVGQFTTSNTLPTGITALTDYYVVSATANTLKVSATVGGSAVDISDVGVGNQTFTPNLTDIDYQAYGSNDGVTWHTIGSPVSSTDTQSVAIVDSPVAWDYVYVGATIHDGYATVLGKARIKALEPNG